MGYTPRLLEIYRKEIRPSMQKELGYKNLMAVPRIEKIVINMGVGEGARDPKELEVSIEELSLIAGQRPKINRARKSISAFHIRAGMPVGCSVTLRGNRMYEFLDRLINIAIPRIRDFRGLSTASFDGRGNYNLGIKEHTIFTELDLSKVSKIRGLDIAIVTTAKTDEECKELLSRFGMPFRT
ncbi:50S ribosomal protein L5 [Candidatus Sumerlaeota bacterium]|nr:50S ribosomal protein L5 [Candidatus Sumerlaeota bacterium]